MFNMNSKLNLKIPPPSLRKKFLTTYITKNLYHENNSDGCNLSLTQLKNVIKSTYQVFKICFI